MKTLMIEPGGWGGIWHYTCCLGNALHQGNVDLRVLTSDQPERPFELQFQILPVLRRRGGYSFNWFHLLRAIHRLNPDLVHFQSWFSARRDWIPFRLLYFLKRPLLVTAHNLLPHDREERNAPFMFWAFKNIYRSASALVAHSSSNKYELMSTYGISPNKVSVIPHGNYDFFAKKHFSQPWVLASRDPGIPKGKKLFLIFGAMRDYKGIDLALKAMREFPDLSNIHLIIAGKPYGDTLHRCKALADALGITAHATFLPGYLTDEQIAELHTLADVILFPYREIFQSGSLQIALAFGKPIIATKVGSFPETLSEKNAWIVEPNSPTAIAQGMQKALQVSAEVLSLMGKESRRLSEEDHDWSSIAEQTTCLYRDLLRFRS